MYQKNTRMFRIVISFLLTGFFISLTAEGLSPPTRGTAGDPDSNITASLRRINEVGTRIEKNSSFALIKCRGELHSIRSTENHIRIARSASDANRFIDTAHNQIRNCRGKLFNEITNIEHTTSGKTWYSEYIALKKYKEDFERYPDLKKHFENEMETAHRQYGLFRDETLGEQHDEDVIEGFSLYMEFHPHFKNPTLPTKFNRMFTRLKERSQCTQEKIKSCHESLLKQVAEDSKSGLKGYCNKALREGQVCCSNPNKSCGDFAFAKEISKSFARSTPALLQTFAQLRGIQGRAEEACKLSALGSVVTPLGNLQIDSCNQAIEGCRETCDSRLAKFKNDFKKCYRIQQGETIRDIIKKAGEGFEDEDPKKPCQEQIAEVAEAYKQLSIDNSYNLSEESDHAEVVACRGAIGRYAPGSGGMGPAEQLAVNMCYGQINPTAQTVTPPGPGNIPYTPPTEVAGFAGTMPNKDFPALSPTPEEGEPRAPGMEEEEDFLPAGPEKPTGSQTGFVPSGGSSPGSGSGPGGSGGPSGGSDNNDKGARALAGLKPGGNSGDFAFQAGMEGEEGDNNSWKEGDDFGPQIEKDRKKAEDLKKLPLKYLSDEERDLLRAFTPPGKNESIFDFHSFMFHWFCRNYGCSGYFKAMGIPEDMRREIEEPKKFTKKKEG